MVLCVQPKFELNPGHFPITTLTPFSGLLTMWSFRPKGDEHTVVLLSMHPQNPLSPTFILPSQTNCLFPSGFCRMKDAILFCQFLWTLPFSPGTASKTVISRTLRKRTGGLLKTVNYNFMSMTEGQIRYTTQALMPLEQKTLESQYTCIYWARTIKWKTWIWTDWIQYDL